jgi:hypothetical protein
MRWDVSWGPCSIHNVGVEEDSQGHWKTAYCPHFCTIYTTRTVVLSLSHSVCTRVQTTQSTCKTYCANGICNSHPKSLCSKQRFYSQTSHASLGLSSPTFTTNMCGQMKIFIQFDVIISNNSFPSCRPSHFTRTSQWSQ